MQPVSKPLSTYINLVRWLAASAVVLYHFRSLGFGSPWVNAHLPANGQAYVMIFFVISGFVIAYTVDLRRSQGPLAFIIDRSVRIYIVALPVLAICFLLSVLRPDILPNAKAVALPAATFFLNATFLSEIWYLEYAPYLNEPYWSLAFEVFYYLIFGIWSFARGWRRWVLLIAACGLAGPKILVLFPCWLMGAAVYEMIKGVKTSSAVGYMLAIGAPVVTVAAFALDAGTKADALSQLLVGPEFYHAKGFLRNWLVAFGFSLHLYGVSQIRSNLFPVNRLPFIEQPARKMADMSYTLYLLHLPIIWTVGSYLPKGANWPVVVLVIAVFPTCYVFALLTEGNRYRVRSWLAALVQRQATPAPPETP